MHQIQFLILFKGILVLTQFLYAHQINDGIQLQYIPIGKLIRKLFNQLLPSFL